MSDTEDGLVSRDGDRMRRLFDDKRQHREMDRYWTEQLLAKNAADARKESEVEE